MLELIPSFFSLIGREKSNNENKRLAADGKYKSTIQNTYTMGNQTVNT